MFRVWRPSKWDQYLEAWVRPWQCRRDLVPRTCTGTSRSGRFVGTRTVVTRTQVYPSTILHSTGSHLRISRRQHATIRSSTPSGVPEHTVMQTLALADKKLLVASADNPHSRAFSRKVRQDDESQQRCFQFEGACWLRSPFG